MRIQGKESEVEIATKDDPTGARLVGDIVALAHKHNKSLRLITVDDMRGFLRELKRTNLNKNTTLLLKKVTGIQPPEIGRNITPMLEEVFNRVSTFSKVGTNGRVHRCYYPYYIFKILDKIIPQQDAESRRILFYIHRKKRVSKTIDDEVLRRVCEQLRSSS